MIEIEETELWIAARLMDYTLNLVVIEHRGLGADLVVVVAGVRAILVVVSLLLVPFPDLA